MCSCDTVLDRVIRVSETARGTARRACIVPTVTEVPRRRRRLELLAIVAVSLAAGLLQHPPGDNQTAHLALVKALFDGTPRIDRYADETADDSFIDGHYYTAKAPGLALFTEPWYATLRLLHLDVANPAADKGAPAAFLEMPRSAIWQVGIAGATLPVLVLMLLVRWAAERRAPGYGGLTAVLGGAGTLLQPFSSLFFAHALAATLGFAAFCVLARERERDAPSPLLTTAAGLAAGLAIVVEFPTAIVALVLAALVLAGADRLRRGAAFALGLVVGVLPLLAFNLWAFGSATTLSYTNAVITPGASGHDVLGANSKGFFGVEVPRLHAAVELLLTDHGLLVVTPVVVFAALGTVLAWRLPGRAEAVACAAICALFLVYNAGYYLPFGGWGPGPRFLVAATPFSLVLVAYALARYPLPVTAVGLCSVASMALANATAPIVSEDRGLGFWLGRLHAGDVEQTVLTRLGVDDRWLAIAPYGLLLTLGVGLALLAARPEMAGQLELTVAAVAGWLLLATSTPELLAGARWTGALAALLLLAAAAVTFALVERVGAVGLVALVPAAVISVIPDFADHSRWALLAAGASMAAAFVLLTRRSRSIPPHAPT